MRRKLLFSISGIFLWMMSACNQQAPPTVKIAVSQAFTLESGQETFNAIQLALDEAEGKAGLVKVELLTFDSYDPGGQADKQVALEIDAANKAVADPAVVAFLGGTSSAKAKASIPITNRAKLTMISRSATWPGLTKPGYGLGEPGIYYPTGQRNFFRVVPSDDVQGVMITHWMNQLGASTVYLISDGTLYSEGLTGILEANAFDQKLKVVGHTKFVVASATPGEIEQMVATIVKAHPDALYYPVVDGAGAPTLIAALRKTAPSIMIFGSDGLVADQANMGSDTAIYEGIYATNVVVDPTCLETAADFVKKYEATYHKIPSAFALSSYEAMNVLLKGIAQAETPTREGVLAAMHKLGPYTGAMGVWQFDSNGDTTLNTITGLQYQQAKWVTITVLH